MPNPPTFTQRPGLLDKQRSIASPGFNRWLVPPAALCLHLCIGMAYGFSVFWLPLTRSVGITAPVACPAEMGFLARLTSTTCDWDKPLLGWIYTLFFVFLGSSAAAFGPWLERAGPRRAGVVATVCWCGGLSIAAAGVALHQLWIVWLGAGVIGGIGLGIGYISPVSTLIRWFPDRRGLATGMAIMGFGGGAMIGAPLADILVRHFAGPRSVGVWETLLALAAIYACFMLLGAFAYRVPPAGWSPTAASTSRQAGAAAPVPQAHSFTAAEAIRTRQFWLLWLVLCLNVSAGIGVIGMASPMLQEIFGGRLIGRDVPFERLDATDAARVAAVAAGFTGLLSLFNILGRFFWSALSAERRVVDPCLEIRVRVKHDRAAGVLEQPRLGGRRVHEHFRQDEHRDIQWKPTRLPDAAFHLLNPLEKVRVALAQVAPRIEDRDDGPALRLFC